MEAGVLVFVVKDVLTFLEVSGIVAPDGTFRQPTVQEGSDLVTRTIKSLEAHGIDIDDDIERVIDTIVALLPLILRMTTKTTPSA